MLLVLSQMTPASVSSSSVPDANAILNAARERSTASKTGISSVPAVSSVAASVAANPGPSNPSLGNSKSLPVLLYGSTGFHFFWLCCSVLCPCVLYLCRIVGPCLYETWKI